MPREAPMSAPAAHGRFPARVRNGFGPWPYLARATTARFGRRRDRGRPRTTFPRSVSAAVTRFASAAPSVVEIVPDLGVGARQIRTIGKELRQLSPLDRKTLRLTTAIRSELRSKPRRQGQMHNLETSIQKPSKTGFLLILCKRHTCLRACPSPTAKSPQLEMGRAKCIVQWRTSMWPA